MFRAVSSFGRVRAVALSAGGLLAVLAAAKVAVHLLTATGYGYFVDELYYLAMQRHLGLGYVDVPPLVPALMAISNGLLGTSLLGLHVFPALAGAGTIVLVGLTAREMGGGRFAQVLAGVSVFVAPFWLILDSWFAYDAFDQLVTAALFYVWVRLLNRPTPGRWLALGFVVGLSLLTKLSIAFTGPALALGFLLTPDRRQLATRWPWLAVALALAMFSPFVLWQAQHAWPILTYWPNYAQYRPHPEFGEFAGLLVMGLNPLALPISLLGLVWLFRAQGGRYRSIGYAFVALFVGYHFVMHTESRMLVSAFLPLIAAGCVALERGLASGVWRRRLRPVYAAALLTSGLVFAPSSLPIEPMDGMINAPGSTVTEVADYQRLRVGWPEMVREIAKVYDALPPAERSNAAIYAGNYGEAAAVDFFGPSLGLPGAISNHLTYQIWGPGRTAEVVIAFGTRFTDGPAWSGQVPLRALFGDVERATSIPGGPDSPEWERSVPVYICRDPLVDLRSVWEQLAFLY